MELTLKQSYLHDIFYYPCCAIKSLKETQDSITSFFKKEGIEYNIIILKTNVKETMLNEVRIKVSTFNKHDSLYINELLNAWVQSIKNK